MNTDHIDLAALEPPPAATVGTLEDWKLALEQSEQVKCDLLNLRSQMELREQQHAKQLEEYRDVLQAQSLLTSERTAGMRRANARLVQVVKALRAVCGHLANQPITSLTYFGGDAFAKSVREAEELLALCDGIE